MARFVMASTYAYSKFAVTRAVAGSQYSMLMPYAKEEDGEARTEGNKVATVKGDKWLVKKVEAKKPGRYGGKFADGAGGIGTKYLQFVKTMDAEFSFDIDTLEELANMVDGGVPTGAKGIELSLKQDVEKFDQLATAEFLGNMPSDNVFLESVMDLDYAGILETLDTMAAKYADSNYATGKVLLVIRSDYYKNFKKALRENHIIANPEIVKLYVSKPFEGEEDGIFVPVEVVRYGNFFIKEAPKDRMYGLVLDCDGRTTGQEDGGVLPLVNLATYRDAYAIFLPIEDAAFAELAHVNVQIAFPPALAGTDYQPELDEGNKRFYGNVNVVDAGINQNLDGVSVHGRVVGGVGMYRPELCFAITSAAAAQTVKAESITFVNPTTGEVYDETNGPKITTDGGTLTMRAYIRPCVSNGTGVCTWASATEAKATVAGSANITNNYGSTGELPYTDVTITAAGNGTSEISLTLGSALGGLVAKTTVTVSNQT